MPRRVNTKTKLFSCTFLLANHCYSRMLLSCWHQKVHLNWHLQKRTSSCFLIKLPQVQTNTILNYQSLQSKNQYQIFNLSSLSPTSKAMDLTWTNLDTTKDLNLKCSTQNLFASANWTSIFPTVSLCSKSDFQKCLN